MTIFLLYLDDIVIFLRLQYNHIENDKRFLSPLRNAGATPKLKKCNFFTGTMD